MNTVNSTSSYPRRNIDFMLRRISMNNRSIGRPQSLAFPLLRLVNIEIYSVAFQRVL